MGVVIVTGVPGVGKSTVMNAAEEYGYKIVNFGTTMFEEAQKDGVADRDDMRKLDVEDQQRLQKQAGEKISRMGNVVVDTHASILTPAGYMPGLPEWTARALNPDIIVLVEATPEEIQGRRNKDSSRERDKDDVGLHQSVNREYAAVAAVITGAAVAIVENHDNQIDKAVEQFRRVLRR
tara:strand:+ start:223 stop:759 length:537 start_codon:yes stop_codon:yes gene_type:complete